MKLQRRKFLRLAAGAAALPALPRHARADAYPSRPVRVIVGYSAGSAPDIIARLMAQYLSQKLGQQFIVDNQPGAGTNLATEFVARAAPDGYTLLLVTEPTRSTPRSIPTQFRFAHGHRPGRRHRSRAERDGSDEPRCR